MSGQTKQFFTALKISTAIDNFIMSYINYVLFQYLHIFIHNSYYRNIERSDYIISKHEIINDIRK